MSKLAELTKRADALSERLGGYYGAIVASQEKQAFKAGYLARSGALNPFGSGDKRRHAAWENGQIKRWVMDPDRHRSDGGPGSGPKKNGGGHGERLRRQADKLRSQGNRKEANALEEQAMDLERPAYKPENTRRVGIHSDVRSDAPKKPTGKSLVPTTRAVTKNVTGKSVGYGAEPDWKYVPHRPDPEREQVEREGAKNLVQRYTGGALSPAERRAKEKQALKTLMERSTGVREHARKLPALIAPKGKQLVKAGKPPLKAPAPKAKPALPDPHDLLASVGKLRNIVNATRANQPTAAKKERDRTDSRGVVLRGNKAYYKGLIVQAGGTYAPRGFFGGAKLRQYFRVREVEFLPKHNLIVASGVLYYTDSLNIHSMLKKEHKYFDVADLRAAEGVEHEGAGFL